MFSPAVDADVPDFSDVVPAVVGDGVDLSDCLVPVTVLVVVVFSDGDAVSVLAVPGVEPAAEAGSDFGAGTAPWSA
ncbi:hypothetical protein AN918_27760 [Mycobacteroides immunogenum]|nr:hypothetical protein AN918_27760 [Mycobacteroides immunogenum]